MLVKKGYGAFPENWKEIVDQVNKVTHNVASITDSTEITKIDGKYLKKNFDVDETGVGKVYYVYVEPEHRFLIISYDRPDYREIYGFFNR